MSEQVLVLNTKNASQVREGRAHWYFSVMPSLDFGKRKENLYAAVQQYTVESQAWLSPIYISFDYAPYDEEEDEEVWIDSALFRSYGTFLYVEDEDDLVEQLNRHLSSLSGIVDVETVFPSFAFEEQRRKPETKRCHFSTSRIAFKNFSRSMLIPLGLANMKEDEVIGRNTSWPGDFLPTLPTTKEVFVSGDFTQQTTLVPPFGRYASLLNISCLESSAVEEEYVSNLSWQPVMNPNISEVHLSLRYQASGELVRFRANFSGDITIVVIFKNRLRLTF